MPKVTPVAGSHPGQGLRCSNSQSSSIHYIMSCLTEPNKLGLRNVMFSIVFIFLLNLAHTFCSLDHLNFYFLLFKEIVPRTINKNDRDIYPSAHSSITHPSTVIYIAQWHCKQTQQSKRERGKDKKDIWDFYEPFSLQCAISNKHYVYSRYICHGLYDALVIVPLPLSIEPL